MLFRSMCTHPMCDTIDATGQKCPHAEPHGFDEDECLEVCCGVLEEPSICDIVYTEDDGATFHLAKSLTR